MDNKSSFEYQVGGSLGSDAPSYVKREADSVFYEALKAKQFCYVLNSRQMGKSSLRVRVMQRLQAEGSVCLFVDLTGMGTSNTREQWYAGIVQSLVSSCEITSLKSQWRTWWKERRTVISPVQKLVLFITEVLLVQIKQNIVIFVDEIDHVLSQKFSLDDFFGLIRYFSEQRNLYPDYNRLTFALLGVAMPSNLIRDKSQTPFNIGQGIELKGFSFNEVQPLVEGLQGKIECPEVVIKEILDWTGGQPFLTQKLCKLIIEQIKRETTSALYSRTAILASELVEQVVKSRLIENWEANDEPEHLRTIRDRILRNEKRVGLLLGLYQKILSQGEIDSDNSPEQMELRLSGLVVKRQGKLQVYNRIYQMVFDRNWVERKLSDLRPYASSLSAWLASSCQDESFLLRGETLQNALTWALGKSLDDLDFQYLIASQNLAKREAQNSLEAIEQASRLLAFIRQKAMREVLKKRISWDHLPKIALAITIPILLLRFTGLLQGLEWNLYDQLFRWRSLEPTENRITIVTIDDSDITKIGQWPLSDQILAQAIATIKTQNLRAIGLDIVRDLPIEPGHTDLVKVFQSTPNLFGIEKMVKPFIAPPPTLNRLDQVGFADLIPDNDGKIRRALLFTDQTESLAMKMVMPYLKVEGINSEDLGNEQLRIGKAIFNPFKRNDGGYVHADDGGYQILLNFRRSQAFAKVSLTQVLNKQIPPNIFTSRLVIIGTTAESLKDFFYTPYSDDVFGFPEQMAGVIVHANIASQILSTVLDGRSLIHTLTKPLEWLWIFIWSGVGTILIWWLKSPSFIFISILVASGGLVVLCYIAFLMGWWLPVVPSLLALWGATISLSMVTSRQRDKLLFHLILSRLLTARADYPIVGSIAIEYFKQSETIPHQTVIERELSSQIVVP